jgi:hypothetical protein
VDKESDINQRMYRYYRGDTSLSLWMNGTPGPAGIRGTGGGPWVYFKAIHGAFYEGFMKSNYRSHRVANDNKQPCATPEEDTWIRCRRPWALRLSAAMTQRDPDRRWWFGHGPGIFVRPERSCRKWRPRRLISPQRRPQPRYLD